MGNSIQSKAKLPRQNPSGMNTFDVMEINTKGQSSLSEHFPSLKWCEVHFLYHKGLLLVFDNDSEIESIDFYNKFEVVSEQLEKFIFTIKFQSAKGFIRMWKIRCKTIQEFKVWKKSLKSVLKMRWINTKTCEICKKEFGVMNRRHHCRKCGKSVCAKCSPIRSTLPELTYKELVRVCLICGDELSDKRKGTSEANTPNFTLISSKGKSYSQRYISLDTV